MRSARRVSAGFSLFEIIVAMGILSVVTTIGATAFIGMTGAWRDTRTLAEMDAAANTAFESIERDVLALLPPALSNTPLRGLESTAEDNRFLQITLADDQLVLPVLMEDTNGLGEPRSVMYRVLRGSDTDGNRLLRVVGPLGDEYPQSVSSDIISRFEVIALRFEFSDHGAGGWATGWAGDTLPRAIRVSMTLKSRSQHHLQLSRKAVFTVPVHE
jgi:prepilin-type N-terminal cleavage/methylation domain-containing protein